MGTPNGLVQRVRTLGSNDEHANGWVRWVALGAAGVGVGVGAYVVFRQLGKRSGSGIDVQHSVTIERPVDEIYRFWREFANLPKVMRHLESVEDLGGGRSHWVAKGPAGSRVSWDAQTTLDRKNEVIAWRSTEGAAVPNRGSVRFRALGDRHTEVRVALTYHPPGGAVGEGFAKLFGQAPSQQIGEDLLRLEQELEANMGTQADDRGRAAA